MNPNQQPPIYTTRHYLHDPQGDSRNNYGPSYDQSRSYAQPYPYYANNQQPTSVTYVNDRSNYGQQATSYVPPNNNRYPPTNSPVRNHSTGPAGGGGGIEKTNMMSNQSPFHDPTRAYEQQNTSRTVTSITSTPKNPGGFNKTLNLSDENPFHTVYGGYHYPSQIDASKRITTQGTAARSTENKSLNLSDENPFFSTYGRYHYPSQIDPQKRITELPKAAGPVGPTNQMSEENPFSNRQPSTYREYTHSGDAGGGANPYSSMNNDWNRNDNNPAPLSYRPIQVQRPPQNQSSFRPPSPPSPPPVRAQPPKAQSSGPMDKTSLNMSPDNPFASSYGQYHYPSSEEIKAQKRASQQNNRFAEQQPVRNNNRPAQPSNQMTEYPETQKSDVTTGKGNSKFTSFEVNF